jgi:hypothetical protein
MNHEAINSRFHISKSNHSTATFFITGERPAGAKAKGLLFLSAVLCAWAATTKAEARPRYFPAQTESQAGCSEPVMRPCVGMSALPTGNNAAGVRRSPNPNIAAHGQAPSWQARQGGESSAAFSSGPRLARPQSERPKPVRVGGIVSPLAAKIREISSSCGSSIVSGVRHTRIANTRATSLHASGQAVDMKGNPRCIYQHLAGWPGGYSTDYGRVQHVHISYSGGGREWGLRFAHRAHHHRARYAHLQNR